MGLEGPPAWGWTCVHHTWTQLAPVCLPHLPPQAAAGLHLQAGADPPIEDGEVGVRGQQHGCEVHLLADADDGNHFEVEGLQGGCRVRERSEVGMGTLGFSEAACWSLLPSPSRLVLPPPTHCRRHHLHHHRHHRHHHLTIIVTAAASPRPVRADRHGGD